MDRKSLQTLRLDRRLIRRRGWLPQGKLESELAALPDVSHKAAEVAPEASRKTPPRDDAPE